MLCFLQKLVQLIVLLDQKHKLHSYLHLVIINKK